jgi:ABC-2 type transport system ATP-binding protein
MVASDSNHIAVDISEVTFRYGKITALDGLSLAVPGGISFGLLGPNGAGKTTLIRLLVGLLKPKSGSVRVLGAVPSRHTANRVGYMPQLHSLYAELSVWQNVAFFARINGLSDRAERTRRVEDTIRLVDLWSRRNDSVTKLSGGMRQRVSLACAVVHNPPLLLLDEPTVGLDPELRVTFWEHFANLNEQGVTIIVSSHTMDDAAHCDRLAFMRSGRVIAQGSPDELRGKTGQETLEEAFLYYVRSEEGNDA